uniref:Uncharacterized protein n=1 Tax=Arundo donax TaxID=35708 RepID=A0A0A9ABF2_ARUDO
MLQHNQVHKFYTCTNPSRAQLDSEFITRNYIFFLW